MFLSVLFIFFAFLAKAQNIGINATGATPNTSAGLDIDFTNKGLLIPRIALTSTTDITIIASPATSSLVYNTNAGITSGSGAGYYYFDGTKWVRLFDSNLPIKAWELLGNAGTNPATNFLGTTDAQDLVFKTANVEKMRILSTGNVGIGISAPTERLNIDPQGNGGMRIGNVNFGSTSLYMGISANAGGYSIIQSVKAAGTLFGDLALNPDAGNIGIGTGTTNLASGAKLNILANGNPDWISLQSESAGYLQNRVACTLGAGNAPIIHLFRGGGTLTAPLATNSTHWLGSIQPGGYDGNSWTPAGAGPSNEGGLLFYSAGNWSPTSHPFKMVLKTVPIGSTVGVERIVIEDNGNVGIGAIVPAYKLEVAGNIGAINFVATSDRRLKSSILPSKYGLKEIMQLKPVTFQWNKDNDGTRVGFIAQEVRKIIPEIVSESKDKDKTLGIYYNEFAPIFTKAIQEQQTIIEKQQKQISDLEKRLEKQEKLLEELLKRK